ncbi:MAG TPA: T9SS type A sorting domain-containing protein [Bacteroidales bacterium]|nr:T9SS type A sorting domain-containing protein [Bacteroidales bacterium]
MRRFKSILTLVLMVSVSLLMAQNKSANVAPKKLDAFKVNKVSLSTDQQISFASYKNEVAPLLNKIAQKNNKRAITMSHMGHSVNIFSVLLEQQTCLSANQDLNAITFTYRQDPTYQGGSGVVRTSLSTNGGTSFDSTTLIPWSLPISTSNYLGRYPSGVIYNPSGNTNYQDAAIVVTGPMLIGGTWGGDFYGSEFLDGTGINNQPLPFESTLYPNVASSRLTLFNRLFLQSHGDKLFVLGDANSDNGTNYTRIINVVNIGQWDATGDSVIWNRVSIEPDFATSNGLPDGLTYPALAMDESGTNGYLIFSGRNPDADDPLSYQPFIYKTENGGNTWTKFDFNWNTIPSIVDHVANYTSSGVNRPFFDSPIEATIDKHGNLHFACYIYKAWSNSADSLGYLVDVKYMNGVLFDIHQTTSGWDATLIDTVWCDDYIFYSDAGGDYTITSRPQMSRTPDGKYIVFAWADSDTSYVTETDNEYNNMIPDIFIKVYNTTTDTYSETINVTEGTDIEGQATWHFLADQCFDLGNGNIKVPISVGILGGAYTSDDRIDYYLLNDVIIGPQGITSYTNTANFSIYPNPVSDQLNINLINKGVNTIKVMNIMGAEVYSTVIDGKDHCTIDLSNLPAGMYIVNVSNSTGTNAKKIVKK